MEKERADRRRAQRRRARLKLRFWNDQLDLVGYTSDVSSTGLFIETRKRVDAETRVHLEVYFKGRSFFAEGVVVRVLRLQMGAETVIKSGLGVRLLSLSEAVRTALAEQQSGDRILILDVQTLADVQALVNRDIKRGGLFVPTPNPPGRDARVIVQISLPVPYESIETHGIVVHVGAQPTGAGVQLTEPDQLRAKLLTILAHAAAPPTP